MSKGEAVTINNVGDSAPSTELIIPDAVVERKWAIWWLHQLGCSNFSTFHGLSYLLISVIEGF